MKRTLLLCLCAVIATASSGSLLAARTVTTVTTTERCYVPKTRVVRTYRVVPRTAYVYERDHHRHGFSTPFRYVGGKLERFFTGRNTIDPW